MTNIWLPGAGLVPIDIRAADEAIRDYDPDHALGRDEVTGDWVVLKRSGPDGEPFPVFNLGRELPGRDEIQRRLYNADVRRKGGKIVEQIQRRNDALKKALRDESHAAAEETAHDISTAFHVAKRHPTPRIFVPGKG
jgi:hypothetical protein